MKTLKFLEKILATFVLLLLSSNAFLQNQVDALRYSQLLYGGTARYIAMGGAFSALGADFSALSTNPASIGIFKSSEFTLSPQFLQTNANATYNLEENEDVRYNLTLNNVGLIFTGDLPTIHDKPEWKNVQFGIGINRLKDFSARYLIGGLCSQSTILDAYRDKAQGIKYTNLYPFDTKLAFETYLLDTINGASNYKQAHYGGAYQRKIKSLWGGLNEIVITGGANYDDKLYLGATIGIPFLRYDEVSNYSEIDQTNPDTLPNFESLEIINRLITEGKGANAKFGLIYRLTDWIRLSAAFHTPTFYTLTARYSVEMFSNLEDTTYKALSPEGRYKYQLETPIRILGGVAFVLANKGAISADYEFVDYSTIRLREKGVAGRFYDENKTIEKTYTKTHNIRVGAELILNPFALRAGYALYTSPYKNDINDGTFQFLSGGIGTKIQNYFVDLSYSFAIQNEDYYFYPKVPSPSENKLTRHLFTLTVGVKF